MATQVQLRRGTTVQHSTFTGAVGEVTFDTDKNTLIVHDGSTAGGYELAVVGNDVTVDDLVVSGNLTVNGTTTTVNSATLSVADNIITLNSDVTGTPSQDAGIEVERGTSTNAVIQWDETNDYWEIASGGTTGRILTTGDSSSFATSSQGSTADSAMQDLVDDTTPQLGGDLASNGNDILFGDNDKAIFGAGSDLQIWHDGSDSYIGDFGTGNLKIQGASRLTIGSTSGEEFIVGNNNDSVELKFNNSTKLATTSTGIDVTGTVTADGLTVDGNALEVTFSGSTSSTVHIKGDASNSGDAGEEDATLRMSTDNGAFHHRISILNGAGQAPMQFTHFNGTVDNKTLTIGHDGDISFYDSAGSNAKFFWDAADESLGIGTDSPAQKLHIDNNSTSSARIRIENSEGSVDLGTDGTDLFFVAGGTEHMRIESSGNVGIGTSSPDALLHVADDSAANDNFTALITAYRPNLTFGDISSSNATDWQIFVDGDDMQFLYGDASTNTKLTSEAMRIDNSGNLLVGKTSASSSIAGTQIEPAGAIAITRSSSTPLYLNRLSSDGDIALFRKDGTTVGSIASDSGAHLVIKGAGTNAALLFNHANSRIEPYANGVTDLGRTNAAFKDGTFTGTLYAARGISNTNTGTPSSSPTPSFDTDNNWVWTLTTNITLGNSSDHVVGQSGFFVFKQDSTGGRTVSLGSYYKTPGGAGLTLSSAANAIDMVPYVVISSTEILLGTPQLAFA